MSTTSTSRTTAAHPARPQLDELDALLEKMLALPGGTSAEGKNHPEGAASSAKALAAPPPPARGNGDSEEPGPKVAARLPDGHPASLHVTATRVAWDGSALPTADGVAGLSLNGNGATGEEPEPGVMLAGRRAMGRDVLALANGAFDFCTLPLGRLGRWLRGSAGRAMLGWMGLTLLAVAVLWYAARWTRWLP